MSPGEPVTEWGRRLQAGESYAAQKLWEEFYGRLVHLARQKLLGTGTPRRVVDEDDIALSAFDSFCRGAEQGRFPRLDDRDDLWQLLVVITTRKAIDAAKHARQEKRDFQREKHESDLTPTDSSVSSGLPALVGRDPDPARALEIAEQVRHLLDALPDDELRKVAVWKMEGGTNDEIAVKLDCATVTVERRLRIIRKVWGRMLPS